MSAEIFGMIVHAHYFVFIILLLYETTFPLPVNSLPVFEHGKKPASPLQENKALIMPVWARKAGGHWKPELLEGTSRDTIKMLGGALEKYGYSESRISPKRADTVELISPSNKDHDLNESGVKEEELEESKENQEEYEYVYDDLNPDEPECPDNMYYHIRGKRCVPVTCPGGNSWRDRDTGECILKHYRNPYRNRWRHSTPWKSYRRTSLFGKGRGGSWAIFAG